MNKSDVPTINSAVPSPATGVVLMGPVRGRLPDGLETVPATTWSPTVTVLVPPDGLAPVVTIV